MPHKVVHNTGNTQNFNRYSYVLNNPLKYTDPSGSKYHFIEQTWWAPGAETFFGNSSGGGGSITPHIDSWYADGSEPGSYSYDYYTGKYTDYFGNEVSFNEVYKNYVVANSSTGRLYEHTSTLNDVNYSSGRMIDGFKLNGVLYEFDSPVPYNQRHVATNSGVSSQGWFTPTGHVNNGIGGFGAGMTTLGGNFRLNNTSGFSPKFYTKPNAAGKIFSGGFGIKTYNTANWGRGIGYGSLAVSVTLGGIYVADAWQQDGNTYGANTQMAVAQTSLGITGAWAEAEIGAAIGVWFGGVGAIPGAVIGGVVGGWGGSKLGETVVNNFSSY